MVALKQFLERPDVTTRGEVLRIAVEVDKAHQWIITSGRELPGASFVASIIDMALDRARREADHDIYIRDPAEPVRSVLNEIGDLIEQVDDATDHLRGNQTDDNLQRLEARVVALADAKQRLAGLQRQTWRTQVVDHHINLAETTISHGRRLVRQITALRTTRLRRNTREALEILIQSS